MKNQIKFIEFCASEAGELLRAFGRLGLNYSGKHKTKNIFLFEQGDITFIANCESTGYAAEHCAEHGPSIVSLGLQMQDDTIMDKAASLGYQTFTAREAKTGITLPSIVGPGNVLVRTFSQNSWNEFKTIHFDMQPSELFRPDYSLVNIDHIAVNARKGNLEAWREFYFNVFDFVETSDFIIQGKQTAFRCNPTASQCGNIKIVLNEDFEDGSQISEFIQANNGDGIQHIAFKSSSMPYSVSRLVDNEINFMKTPDSYYDLIDGRIPGHGENVEELRKHNILIDNDRYDKNAILLQVFTESLIGPIFFELIHRKGNEGFGEGNVKALFEAVELDQRKRGLLA
ncbi:4-hydroxyphenylpyruvate dioxygenase [Thalassomonas haliotis]|uniref:4-hydroxyphenylpyruvate dioxygenase n=1 Tax=Thalassomonas haliotis TaxID=485448 RepID=A0ABY7VEK6_9GAMM|nr:4-hydroxyphenylpyruvate dioxygenase [Thalassomonas haliotis]WDE11574.1 4-hydroxyphenylpyruvate dioxygenase [Thalassomonas haliotis]